MAWQRERQSRQRERANKWVVRANEQAKKQMARYCTVMIPPWVSDDCLDRLIASRFNEAWNSKGPSSMFLHSAPSEQVFRTGCLHLTLLSLGLRSSKSGQPGKRRSTDGNPFIIVLTGSSSKLRNMLICTQRLRDAQIMLFQHRHSHWSMRSRLIQHLSSMFLLRVSAQ